MYTYTMCIYVQALDFNPIHKPCLIKRSQCYRKLGEMEKSIADADVTLADKPNYYPVFLHF